MKLNRYSMLVILSGVLFGIAGLFNRNLYARGFTPADCLAVDYGVAALLFGVTMLFADRPGFKIRPRHLWCFVTLGIFGMMMMTFLYYQAMGEIAVGIATLLTYTGPVWAMLLSRLLFREAITRRSLLALVLIVIGSALVSGLGGDSTITPKGFLLGVLAGVFGGTYGIFMRFAIDRKYRSLTVSFYGVLFAAIGALIVGDPIHLFQLITASWTNALLCLGLGLCCCYLPTMAYASGLKGCQPGVAAMLSSLSPVVAVIVGFAAFRERIGLMSLCGIVIVLAALILMNIQPKQSKEMDAESA